MWLCALLSVCAVLLVYACADCEHRKNLQLCTHNTLHSFTSAQKTRNNLARWFYVVTRAFASIALRICHCLEREFATHVVSSTAQCAFLNCRRRRRLQHAYTYENVLGARL